MARVLLAVALVLVVSACGSEQSEAEKIRSIDEELSTLPDVGPGLGEASPQPSLKAGWKTDFSRRTVPLAEIRPGGPGKDGIPAIDDPKFLPVADVDFLESKEPVVAL